MGLVQDFVGRVTDPYRTPAPAAKPSGAKFIAANAAVASWLAQYPAVEEFLGSFADPIDALEGAADGARAAFDKRRAALDDAKAEESRAHFDARERGLTLDGDIAKRLTKARTEAARRLEEAGARATLAVRDHVSVRDALNAATAYINQLAASGSKVSLASPVTLPKDALPLDAIEAQRQARSELLAKKADATRALLPVDDAVAVIRGKVRGVRPVIHLAHNDVDWTPQHQYINAQPRIGEESVSIDDSTSLLCWLFGDAVADKLEAEVRARYAELNPLTLSAADRRKALADLDAQLLAAERIEVAAVFAVWAVGAYVALRPDTSPLALLGIEKVIS